MCCHPHGQWGRGHVITNHAFVENGMKKGRSLGESAHGKNYGYLHTPIHLPTSHPLIYPFFHPTLHPTHPSIHPPCSLFTHQSLLSLLNYLSLIPSIDFSFLLFPSTHPLLYSFFFLFIYLASILTCIHLPIYPYIHPMIRLSFYPSAHPSFHHYAPDCMCKRRDDENNYWVWRQRLSAEATLTSISLPSSEKMCRMCCLPCPILMTISFCAGSEVRAEVGGWGADQVEGQQEGPCPNCSTTTHGSQNPAMPSHFICSGPGEGRVQRMKVLPQAPSAMPSSSQPRTRTR